MIPKILPRRTFLRATGVCIGLPLLEAMMPKTNANEEQASPKRLVLIGRPLGFHAPYFFPEKTGLDYTPSRYLKPLAELKNRFTVFSGMSHRGYPGGHSTTAGLMTGVGPEGMRFNDVRNTISLDQVVAAKIGGNTRFRSLILGGGDLSWNEKGVRIPSEDRATVVFKQLFVQGTANEIAEQTKRIHNGRSILDGVREQALALQRALGTNDRRRIELMLTSVREAEQRLQQELEWIKKPKPKVDAKPYTEDYFSGRLFARSKQWYDLMHLALQTDSTRVISLFLWSHESVDLQGVTLTHHDASHHGLDEGKIAQLSKIEEAETTQFGEFLRKLNATNEPAGTLLDRTAIFYGSNLGNASAHTCDNLPIILAGGGFKHAGHVAYDKKDNKPISNLFVRMLKQLDLPQDKFGSSTGTLHEV